MSVSSRASRILCLCGVMGLALASVGGREARASFGQFQYTSQVISPAETATTENVAAIPGGTLLFQDLVNENVLDPANSITRVSRISEGSLSGGADINLANIIFQPLTPGSGAYDVPFEILVYIWDVDTGSPPSGNNVGLPTDFPGYQTVSVQGRISGNSSVDGGVTINSVITGITPGDTVSGSPLIFGTTEYSITYKTTTGPTSGFDDTPVPGQIQLNVVAVLVPEPSSIAMSLAGIGLLGVAGLRSRRWIRD